MKPLPFDLSNLTLNIIIGIATLGIGILAFGSEISEVDKLKVFKSLSFRIVTLIACSFVIVWATAVKDINNDIRAYNDGRERDSTSQQRFNESLTESSSAASKTITQTLAGYYLKYDSLQHKIEKIVKDSSRTTVSERPYLDICGIRNTQIVDTSNFEIEICVPNTAAVNVDFKYCMVCRHVTDKLEYFMGDRTRVKKITSATGLSFLTHYINKRILLNDMYFFVYGTYNDAMGKSYVLNSIWGYKYSENRRYYLTDKEKAWISAFIAKNQSPRPL